jgi:hypothetical protein
MHQSVKKLLVFKSKKANWQGFFNKIYSEPGLEPEPKEIISAPQHWCEV